MIIIALEFANKEPVLFLFIVARLHRIMFQVVQRILRLARIRKNGKAICGGRCSRRQTNALIHHQFLELGAILRSLVTLVSIANGLGLGSRRNTREQKASKSIHDCVGINKNNSGI